MEALLIVLAVDALMFAGAYWSWQREREKRRQRVVRRARGIFGGR